MPQYGSSDPSGVKPVSTGPESLCTENSAFDFKHDLIQHGFKIHAGRTLWRNNPGQSQFTGAVPVLNDFAIIQVQVRALTNEEQRNAV